MSSMRAASRLQVRPCSGEPGHTIAAATRLARVTRSLNERLRSREVRGERSEAWKRSFCSSSAPPESRQPSAGGEQIELRISYSVLGDGGLGLGVAGAPFGVYDLEVGAGSAAVVEGREAERCSPPAERSRRDRDAGAFAERLEGPSHQRSAEFLGEPDEKSFGPPDVAEPIRVFVLDHIADELRAALAEPGERIVDVLHGEHDA